MAFNISLLDLLPRFIKVQVAEELKDFMEILTALKIANVSASTYLLSGSVESYLASVNKTVVDYVVVPVSSYSEDESQLSLYSGKFEVIEQIIDRDGTVGAKLFEGGDFDMNQILAEKNMIWEAKEMGAVIVVGLTSQYDGSSGGYSSIFLEGVALVPKN